MGQVLASQEQEGLMNMADGNMSATTVVRGQEGLPVTHAGLQNRFVECLDFHALSRTTSSLSETH